MSKPDKNKTPFTFLGISSSLEALRVMIAELRKAAAGEIENFEVDMSTFGELRQIGPNKLLCVGCAATVTLMKLSGLRLDAPKDDQDLTDLGLFEEGCAEKSGISRYQVQMFECAIDDARRGKLQDLLNFFRDDPRKEALKDIYERQMQEANISYVRGDGLLYGYDWVQALPRWEAFLAAVEVEVAALPCARPEGPEEEVSMSTGVFRTSRKDDDPLMRHAALLFAKYQPPETATGVLQVEADWARELTRLVRENFLAALKELQPRDFKTHPQLECYDKAHPGLALKIIFRKIGDVVDSYQITRLIVIHEASGRQSIAGPFSKYP